ncbi:MAG: thiamine-phosphate kinase [Rhodoferax sp.]|nr:thiamine-phosphate kinase [Rhodoferax sp.]
MNGEFDLIARHFTRPVRQAVLGVGDDCALLAPRPGTHWAISTDMLVEGRHFLPSVAPQHLGHKALAVNLSDLAACGATPRAFTLALALPEVDDDWLSALARGLFELADAQGCELVGGDTTRGPLNLCITVMGEVPVIGGRSQALLRSGARPGDRLYVSGTLGDAALALDALTGRIALPEAMLSAARLRLEQPTPRVALGLALRGVASAALDISDGLLGDLRHVLQASGVGATVDADAATALIAASRSSTGPGVPLDSMFSVDQRRRWALAGGDDYELLFTAPPHADAAVAAAAAASATPVACIGCIDAEPGLRLQDGTACPIDGRFDGYDHFA